MSQTNVLPAVDARRSLVERVAASRYVNRSARLRDLLLYLAGRVLDEDATEIHEQEVGHSVFGRRKDYDTSSDNIVRVHASTLRRRLEQYFAAEGVGEPLIIEIPKGNYAPVFHPRERAATEVVPAPAELAAPEKRADWRLWVLTLVAVSFACSTAYLLVRRPASQEPSGPLWSQIFRAGQATDIVLDDAALGLYQELTGKTVALSDYFDRTYLRNLSETAAAAAVDPRLASAILLRRQSNVAGANFLWKLFEMAGAGGRPPSLRFARDYSFRELKANNAVLLGTSRSNPWVEAFEPKLGLRWAFDKASGTYYPVDSWSGDRAYRAASGDAHEGYCAASLVANLGQSGNVLLIAGTGGSAIAACAGFLGDEGAVAGLMRKLPAGKNGGLPHFEALIQVKGRGALPRDAVVVVSRAVRE